MLTMDRMRERMARLEREAAVMGTANHGRFLSEAMQALRDPVAAGDAVADEIEAPLRALRLLNALWGSSYADRPEPKAALNDVGAWLERRIAQAPAVKTTELLIELGWLKRLSRYQEGLRWEAGSSGARMPLMKTGTQSFGKRIAELDRRRRAALAASEEAPRGGDEQKQRSESLTPEPIALPEEAAVEFVDFAKAREVRSVAAARVKRGREPKEALLYLAGVGGVVPGVRFECSTTRTAGMAEVFERIRTTPGAPDWALYAGGLERRADGMVLVGRLSLAPARVGGE